ncbi:MAG: ASKHA domain-containing protein, partial [Candidatus Bathyarchaeia archaeon]
MVTVRFEPEGRRFMVRRGATLLEAAQGAGIEIRSECGGKGTCGTCRVIVENQANLSDVSERELRHIKPQDLRLGYRLACQTIVEGDTVVYVPTESRLGLRRIQVEGMERPVQLDPAVRKFHLTLIKPTIQDVKPDLERLLDSLQKVGINQPEIDHELLKALPDILREAEWNVTVAVWDNRRIISLEKGDTEDFLYGFSVDIGTSKVVGYLINLRSGNVVAVKSTETPQIAYGEDVLSRISYAMKGRENLERLRETVTEAINTLIFEACQEAGVNLENIYEVTVVGNTAMHHFFLGIQPRYLAVSPYVPALRGAVNVEASSPKIAVNPHGNVHVLPVIAGFVGADAVADVLATGVHEAEEMSLLMDVGTNGEVFVGNRGHLISCSCAAGPAFEGMHIKHGMKASTGAIERLRISPDTLEVEYETIGGGKPIGICGSGIVDAVAEMFKCGIINRQGAFNKNIQTPRLQRVNGEIEFVIAESDETGTGSPITVGRRDVEEIQLAKAAMHTGAAVLMKRMGV